MAAAVLAVLGVACSTETPTAPVQMPAPVISALVANFTCAVTDNTVQFFDLSSGNPTTWKWDFGDGGKSSKQDPVHTYNQILSDYLVTLTVSKGGSSPATAQAFLSQVVSTTGGSCLPSIAAAPE